MKECKHPTCGETCRRPKPQKKIYQLKRTPIRKQLPKDGRHLPYNELLKLAEMVFNKWIHKRDSNESCISTGLKKDDKGRPLQMQAGHYYPAGKYSGVRFDEVNVNAQCKWDNCVKEGAVEDYRAGLIERYGLEAVQQLDARAETTKLYKWGREELGEIILKYQ